MRIHDLRAISRSDLLAILAGPVAAEGITAVEAAKLIGVTTALAKAVLDELVDERLASDLTRPRQRVRRYGPAPEGPRIVIDDIGLFEDRIAKTSVRVISVKGPYTTQWKAQMARISGRIYRGDNLNLIPITKREQLYEALSRCFPGELARWPDGSESPIPPLPSAAERVGGTRTK